MILLVAVAGVLLDSLLLDHALAQSTPFGTPRPPAQASADGLFGWILQKQAEFYRSLSAAIRNAKADGSAVWGLFGLSFAYGIFHAAGPGHGKAVISSYLVANEETWRRGVVLSFASAFLQALVAVAIVGIAAALLNATAGAMSQAVRYIEIVSYALILLLGLRLTWTKGRAFVAAWRGQGDGHDHGHHDDHAHAHDRHNHAHDHHHHAHHGHDHHHDHGHVHDEHCGHSHGPEPAQLAGPGGWKRGLTAVIAVGARPCSGAILVLVFALAQGLFWAGVAATFIMGLGTAITVAAIATMAVWGKALLRRLVENDYRKPLVRNLIAIFFDFAVANAIGMMVAFLLGRLEIAGLVFLAVSAKLLVRWLARGAIGNSYLAQAIEATAVLAVAGSVAFAGGSFALLVWTAIGILAGEIAARFVLAAQNPGLLVMRAIEVAAAIAVVLFGAGLLTGYLISERMGFA